jgi:superfamily II DNA/RNA helicase
VNIIPLVQAMTCGPILSGEDVVLAAETGSGKTYAYLVPLISLLLERKAARERAPRSIDQSPPGSPLRAPRDGALILCPNAALCDQVRVPSLSSLGLYQTVVIACSHVSSGHARSLKNLEGERIRAG